MTKEEIILAALASCNDELSPIQLQKLFFLLDMQVGKQLGGPFFNFVPYNYGPFDKGIYETYQQLSNAGYTTIRQKMTARYSYYGLTDTGRQRGNELLQQMNNQHSTYIHSLARFVETTSFDDLLRAVYKAYPDMATNSVFKG